MVCGRARGAVQGAGQGSGGATLPDKEADKITRPEKIPAKLDDLAATKDAVVADMPPDAARHAEEAAATLRVQVMTLQDLVATGRLKPPRYSGARGRSRGAVAEATSTSTGEALGRARQTAGAATRRRTGDLDWRGGGGPSRVAERNALVDAETARGKEALEKLEARPRIRRRGRIAITGPRGIRAPAHADVHRARDASPRTWSPRGPRARRPG